MQIARRLLGKILIDLRNTREEAINVAELKSNDAQHTKSSKKEDANPRPKSHTKNEDTRKSSATDISIDQEDDDETETEYRLDPKCVNIFSLSYFFSLNKLCFKLYVCSGFDVISSIIICCLLLSGMLM